MTFIMRCSGPAFAIDFEKKFQDRMVVDGMLFQVFFSNSVQNSSYQLLVALRSWSVRYWQKWNDWVLYPRWGKKIGKNLHAEDIKLSAWTVKAELQ